jgi:hypothetical protein
MSFGGIPWGGGELLESGAPSVVTESFASVENYRRARYEWILCESPDISDPFAPLVKIGSLNRAKNRSFDLVRNRAGGCSFTIHTDDPMAYAILDRVILGDVRGTVRKCVRIRRNAQELWSGPIWGIEGSLANDTITVHCVGWLETLVKKILWGPGDFTNEGSGLPADQVAFGLLNLINDQDPAHPLLIKPGTVTGTLENRNRYYQYGQQLGSALQELSDIEAGFDYEVDPVTREMNLYSWNSYRDRTDIILGYQWGPNNLKDMQWRESGDQMTNKMVVVSQGAPVGPITDDESQDEYGNYEEYVTLTGANQDVLLPYGVSELVIRSRPLVTYSLVPSVVGGQAKGPILFNDFQIGDKIYFSARKNAFKITNQAVRIFGASVSLDDNGNETVTQLMTSPSS